MDAINKMDQEKLIEMVKSCEPLYVMSHSKYSDNIFKENAWRRISKEMNQPSKMNIIYSIVLIK